jgi:sugar-specific transcriptional regulator TrmB
LSECNKLLVDLGLSPTQSKIYLANLQIGKATVKDISNNCNIAREDVYKGLPSLQTLGIVTKHLSSPIQYQAIELKETIEVLLGAKQKQYSELKKGADQTLKNFKKPINDSTKKELENTFVSATENVQEAIDATKEAQITIDFTTRYNLFAFAMNSQPLEKYIKEMRKAADRGIKFRMLIDNPEKTKPVYEISYKLSESKKLVFHKNFEYRYLDSPLNCIMIIYDNKKCLIETSTEKDVRITPQIWTNNLILVELCKTYFEKNWCYGSKPMNIPINNETDKRKRTSNANPIPA